MDRVFFAHASDDYEIVRQLAQALEVNGFTCWYYQRNTAPGRNYLAQIQQAIDNSKALVAVVSEKSMDSHHVKAEIDYAFRKGIAIIPLLCNCNGETLARPLKSGGTHWDFIFGANQRIAWSENADHTAQLIESALLEAGVPRQIPSVISRRSPAVNQVRTPRPALGSTPAWASDGTQVDISVLEKMVFQTHLVTQYLSSEQKMFVRGTKGVGKTLLLRCKRHLLTEQHRTPSSSNGHTDILCIPVDRPFVDMMTDLPPALPHNRRALFELENCKKLWSFAIQFSIISHLRAQAAELRPLFKNEDATLLRWLDGKQVAPSQVFKHAVDLPFHQIDSLLNRLSNALEQALREVNRAVYVFIDKVDQGISRLPRDAWINVQAGLLEAAWDCSSTNAHVKVFGTIRDEAYANYASPLKSNIRGAVLPLKYEHEDLRKLTDSLAHNYEGTSDFASFVHLSAVRNTRGCVVEDSFEYVLRHTVGRPRDLVQICSALSDCDGCLTEDRFRAVVNETAESAVVDTLFSEMEPFLNCLRSRSERERVFKLFPYNILTRNELLDALLKFRSISVGRPDGTIGPQGDKSPDPFAELWYCGLLGVVGQDYQGKWVQQFKQPHDLVNIGACSVPVSKVYLLHPALQTTVRTMRGDDEYKIFRTVVVGHGYEWYPYSEKLIELQRQLCRLEHDCRGVFEVIDDALECFHAGWSEGRDPREFMSKDQQRTIDRAAEEAEMLGHDAFVEALKAVWAAWSKPRRGGRRRGKGEERSKKAQ